MVLGFYGSIVWWEVQGMFAQYAKNDKLHVSLVLASLWTAWAYIHTRVIIDNTLLKRKIVVFAIVTPLGIFLMGLIQFYLLKQTGLAERNKLADAVVRYAWFTGLMTFIYLGVKYLLKSRELYQLEAIKQAAELNQLKTQLNPHFLFNALNNIYSYNLENYKHGNDLILKLGELMRFILELSPQEKIRLDDEIAFIDNYISFEKERIGYRCDIQYKKDVSDMNIKLPPLLLFPFVENAFKHGSLAIYPTTIGINIRATNTEINIMVINQILNRKLTSTKIGLSNIERRLELLFPGTHQLDIQDENGYYKVNLNLKFNGN